MLKNNDIKIFILSFHKVATTSTARFLESNGFYGLHDAHKSMTQLGLQGNIQDDKYIGDGNITDINKIIDVNKLKDIVNNYSYFSDMPWPVIWKTLKQMYPNAKYILFTRNDEDWYNSLEKWCKGQNHKIRKYIYGYGNPTKHKKRYLDVYNKHNRDVINTFKGNKNFININLNTDNEIITNKLSKFLHLKGKINPFIKSKQLDTKGRIIKFDTYNSKYFDNTFQKWLINCNKIFFTTFYRKYRKITIKKYVDTSLYKDLLSLNEESYNNITNTNYDKLINDFIIKIVNKNMFELVLEIYLKHFNIFTHSSILFLYSEETYKTLENYTIVKNINDLNYKKTYDLIYIYQGYFVKNENENGVLIKFKNTITSLIAIIPILSEKSIVMIRLNITPINYLFDFIILLSNYCTLTYINNPYINDNITWNSIEIILTDMYNVKDLKYKLEKIMKIVDFRCIYEGFIIGSKNCKVIKELQKIIRLKSERRIFLKNMNIKKIELYKKQIITNLFLQNILINFKNRLWFKTCINNNSIIKLENKSIKLNSSLNYEEGENLYDLILKNKCYKIIQIGMGYGITSLFITLALYSLDKEFKKKGKLISIDQLQSSKWNNIGIYQIKKLKTHKYHKLIKDASFLALPAILTELEKDIDLIFIDRFNTYDHLLTDIYYSLRLLRLNGLLVIKDAKYYGVAQVIKYIDNTYFSFLKKIYYNKLVIYKVIK